MENTSATPKEDYTAPHLEIVHYANLVKSRSECVAFIAKNKRSKILIEHDKTKRLCVIIPYDAKGPKFKKAVACTRKQAESLIPLAQEVEPVITKGLRYHFYKRLPITDVEKSKRIEITH